MRAKCEVTLRFSPLGNPESKFKKSAESCSPESVQARFMHWAVYFDFQDGTVYKCEATLEKEDLVGYMKRCKNVPNDDEDKVKKCLKKCLGEHALSYEDLCEAYHDMGAPTTYSVFSNNCQTWALDLLEHLHIPFPGKLKAIAKTISYIFGDYEAKASEVVISYLQAHFKKPYAE